MRAHLRCAAFVVAALVGRSAAAQDLADLPPSATLPESLTTGIEQHRPFWQGSGPTRLFMASNIDAGAVYLRPAALFGYGKPHYQYIAAEVGSGIALASVRGFAGIRALIPGVSLRVGARFEHPVSQTYLPRQDAYAREDLDQPDQGRGIYVAGEAELVTSIPVPSGSIIGVVTGMYVSNVPDDVYVFEQSMRVVLDPPWLWRMRLGYLYHLGWQGTMKLGFAGEVIHMVQRQAFAVRAGPALSVALTHHLEALAAVMIVAHSPDALGLAGADLGQIGLRYRWATGDAWAAFP